MTRFYPEQRLDHDANLDIARAAEARKNKPRRITRISEAREVAREMLSYDNDDIAICWDAEDGCYKCIPDRNHRAKNVIERVRGYY